MTMNNFRTIEAYKLLPHQVMWVFLEDCLHLQPSLLDTVLFPRNPCLSNPGSFLGFFYHALYLIPQRRQVSLHPISISETAISASFVRLWPFRTKTHQRLDPGI